MNPTTPSSNAPPRAFPRILKAVLFSALTLSLTNQSTRADSATWTGALSSNWNDDRNWNPATVPDGPDDVATFAVSDQTAVDVNYEYGFETNSIVFEPDASSFACSLTEGDLSFSGAGITNNSGKLQTFDCKSLCDICRGGYPNSFDFYNSATAGELTALTIEGPTEDEIFGGQLWFYNSSTAGSALITNAGGSNDSYSATTFFVDESSAENATIINEGSTAPYAGGRLNFDGNATASHATIINNGALSKDGQGGQVGFSGSSDSGDSTIICNGDTVGSDYPATLSLGGPFGGGVGAGGRARVILHGNGELDVAGGVYRVKVTIGSIEGDGNIFLGDFVAGELTVGTNNRSTTFAGIIQDTSFFSGGELQKIGAGTLTLTGANTYAGSTTVKAGNLKINNSSGSGTGTGAVRVKGGTLSGRGTIAGAVTIGTGLSGGILSPGDENTGTLTIQSDVTFKTASTYAYNINTNAAQADELIAKGVRINRGVVFCIVAFGHSQIAVGTVFTVIDNTAATPISGAFVNLRDGSTFVAAGNRFQVSYEGGDGNDLTLTVVP
jgi:autotransporter-associated beta strand protein